MGKKKNNDYILTKMVNYDGLIEALEKKTITCLPKKDNENMVKLLDTEEELNRLTIDKINTTIKRTSGIKLTMKQYESIPELIKYRDESIEIENDLKRKRTIVKSLLKNVKEC